MSFKNNIHLKADVHPNAKIGEGTKIHAFVYIEGDVEIGKFCKIKPNVYIPNGVKIGNRVFIGSNVAFINDKHPSLKKSFNDFCLSHTVVEDYVSIGSGSVIMPVKIGERAVVGAGSVVTHDVSSETKVFGNPALRPGDVR